LEKNEKVYEAKATSRFDGEQLPLLTENKAQPFFNLPCYNTRIATSSRMNTLTPIKNGAPDELAAIHRNVSNIDANIAGTTRWVKKWALRRKTNLYLPD